MTLELDGNLVPDTPVHTSGGNKSFTQSHYTFNYLLGLFFSRYPWNAAFANCDAATINGRLSVTK